MRRRLVLALTVGVALLLVVALAVSAQAATVPSGTPTTNASVTPTSIAAPAAPVRTHSNAGSGVTGAAFSVACVNCHISHQAADTELLGSDATGVCAKCHDPNAIHSDPATKQAVSALPAPVDCLTCHPHSSGFMPVSLPLTVSKQALGYDDLDADGNLSPGDRVHYRVDYANPGLDQATGVTLADTPDSTHVLSVEAVSDGGTFDGTAIKWTVGALTAGASGFVTYDLVLKDSVAFDAGVPGSIDSTTTTDSAAPATSSTDSTSSSTTTTATSASAVDNPTTTGTTATTGDLSTTTTLATSATATVDVANTVTLTEDNREPVTAAATVTVAVGGSSATTPTTTVTTDSTATSGSTTTTDSTTTTALSTTDTTAVAQLPTTSTTIAPVFAEVASMASLTADAQMPISALATVSVLLSGSPGATPTTTPTIDGPTIVQDPLVTTLAQLPIGSPSTDSVMTFAAESPMIVLSPFALTLSQRAVGYADLDKDGYLSPGDRIHYRIDYGNPGVVDATGAAIRNVLDTAHVASVEAISGSGTEIDDPDAQIPTSVEWNIGALPAGTSGFLTYDVVLRDDIVMVRADWAFPVQGPNHYYDDFGDPRYAGGYHTHTGNDILCARGTPLVAVVSGVVTRANRVDQGLGGRTVWLRGDDGNSYYYAHLSMLQPGVDDGVRVVMGQVLGFAGNTGDAAGGPFHLHFAIHPDGGAAVDPYLVLKGDATVAEVAALSLTTTTTSSSTTTTTGLDTTTTTGLDTPTTTGLDTTTTTAPDTTTTTGLDTTTTTASTPTT